MSWRDIMGVPPESLTHNSQNTQNPGDVGNSAYCADIAYSPKGVSPTPKHGPGDAVTGEGVPHAAPYAQFAQSAEPTGPTPTREPASPLRAPDKAKVEAAMDAMGETCPDTRREVLDRCATDPEALAFWTSPARTPDPRQALYHRWLAGITEERALLTLDAVQAREAVAAGVVSRDLARASVLLLVRSPAGDLGPGAVVLLAIPKAKYAGFSPAAALDALAGVH